MSYVFVVLGEDGEYSDRSVWVAGVFCTEDEARARIAERLSVRAAYDAWHMALLRELRTMKPDGRYGAWSDEQQAAARAKVPAEPPHERGERFEIEAAQIGAWLE